MHQILMDPFHINCCKNCIVGMKQKEMNKKRPGMAAQLLIIKVGFPIQLMKVEEMIILLNEQLRRSSKAFENYRMFQPNDLVMLWTVWQDWAIFCTFGNFLKPLAPINLPKSLTFLGNFSKGVKIYHFSYEIIFGQL